MNVLGACAGYGGVELGLQLATNGEAVGVCYVEREAFAAASLAAQMEAGLLAPAPIWLDLANFDGLPWRGVVDCVTAGFPCQPWSVAGKQHGEDDERWLWPEIARVLREIRPGLVFLENVPALASGGGIGRVLWTLAELGFDAEWDVFGASCVGAPHQRRRLFVLGYANGEPIIRSLAQAAAVCDDGARANAGAASDRPAPEALSDADRLSVRVEPGRCGRQGGAGEAIPCHGGAWPPLSSDADGWRAYIAAGGPEPAILRGSNGASATLDMRLRSFEDWRLLNGQALAELSAKDGQQDNPRDALRAMRGDQAAATTPPRHEQATRRDRPLPDVSQEPSCRSRDMGRRPQEEKRVHRVRHQLLAETQQGEDVRAGVSIGTRQAQRNEAMACTCPPIDRIRLCGGGVVPLVAAHAIRTLAARAVER